MIDTRKPIQHYNEEPELKTSYHQIIDTILLHAPQELETVRNWVLWIRNLTRQVFKEYVYLLSRYIAKKRPFPRPKSRAILAAEACYSSSPQYS